MMAPTTCGEETIDILGRRIGSLDLKPAFSREGDDRIVVEIPRPARIGRLKAVIVAPGRLAFRFIDTSVAAEGAKAGKMPPEAELLQDRSGEPFWSRSGSPWREKT